MYNVEIKYIIAVRHEKHVNNILSRSAQVRSRQAGRRLLNELKKRKIYLPELAISSPQWRTVSTLSNYLGGMKISIPLFGVYEQIGDAKSGRYPFSKKELKYVQKTSQGEKILLKKFPKKSQLRGLESLKLLESILLMENKSFIFVSHGCSRLEPINSVLTSTDIKNPSFYYEYGGAALLKFEVNKKKVKLINIEYFGNLGNKKP